jgi:hypothetical protein
LLRHSLSAMVFATQSPYTGYKNVTNTGTFPAREPRGFQQGNRMDSSKGTVYLTR